MPPIFYSSAVLLWLTLTIYWLVNLLRTRTGSPLVNPVVLTSLIMIIYLKSMGLKYEHYISAGQLIDFWLKPAVVVLAVPLYLNWEKIRKQWLSVIVAQCVGSLTGIVSSVCFAKWLGADDLIATSLAAKSVTNPIALEITRMSGGIPAITAATVVVSGMTGQMAGYFFMQKSRVRKPMSQSLSMGSASHAMGIAASLEKSPKFAVYASLGLIFNGILTAVFVPILLPLLL